MPDRLAKPRRVAATATAAVALLLYLWTLAPTVTFVDSGELIVVADALGVAHPPGFPLYTLLAHAATWLPIGTAATRVNALSAMCAAAATATVALLVWHLVTRLNTAGADGPGRRGRRSRGQRPIANPDFIAVAAAIGAGLFATSRTLWTYATVAEVYTLNVALVAAALLMLVRWREQQVATGDQSGQPGDGALYAAAGLTGLALGVHHVTTVLMLPAFAVLVLSSARSRPVPRRVWLGASLLLAAGTASYLYLPIAASTSPLFNWGDPDSLQRFWWHVSGRQYQVFVSFSLDMMAQQFREAFVPFLTREFGPSWMPVAPLLALVGLGALWKRDRTMAAALILVVFVNLAYALNYDIDEDQDAYYVPAFFALAVAAGAGAGRLLAAAGRRTRAIQTVLLAAVCAVPVMSFASNLRFADRSRYVLAHDYVTNILGTVRPGGLLLTLDWQVYSPLLYLRHVEGVRPDVVAIDVNLLRRSWYFEYLFREYPELMEATRADVTAFLEDLRRWEQDPDAYERDVALTQRINDRFYAMIAAFVGAHAATGPVYLTQDVLVMERGLAARLAAYTQVPQGLVFELSGEPGFVPPAEPRFEMRGLFDGTMTFEPDDVVRVKVAPAYVSMIVNRGRYLAAFGYRDRAIALYEEALTLDPGNAAAIQSLRDARERQP